MTGGVSVRHGSDLKEHVGVGLLGLTVFASFVLLLPSAAQGATLEKPEDIVCVNDGNADVVDSVQVRWENTSEDHSGYEVQRSVEGGDFTNVDELDADAERYADTDVDDDSVYRYRVRAVDDGDTGPFSEACRRPRMRDTDLGNFRVYYRPYPTSDAPQKNGGDMTVPSTTTSTGDNEYAARIGGLLEGSRTALIDQVGFKDFASFDSDDPIRAGEGEKPAPADLHFLGSTLLGKARRSGQVWLNPIAMKPYDPSTGANASSVGTTLHEAFHEQQYIYDGVWDAPSRDWVYEGQAASIEDKVCVGTIRSSCVSLDKHSGWWGGYPGRIGSYLDAPHKLDLTRRSYSAALFWTYVLEQYGDMTQEPERGMDFLVDFWERAEAERNDTGIGTINRALEENGESARFDDVFKDFVVANYAKDLDASSVPDAYRYQDQDQFALGLQYKQVARAAKEMLAAGDQIGPRDGWVSSRSARYYEVTPEEDVDTLDIAAEQLDPANPAFYVVLAVKNNELVGEWRGSGNSFAQTLENRDFDRVVLIVAGIERHLARTLNFEWSVNAEDPVMNIVDPITERPAKAGDPSDPGKFLTKVEVRDPDGGPLEGVDVDEFTVTVGDETVAETDMVSRSRVQDEYWLLVPAPDQDGGAGEYDLTVAAAGLSATETDAVHYGPRKKVDNEVVVDRSGSMGDHDKLVSAQSAAHLYVDTWPSSDMAGLVSFNASPRVDVGLDTLEDEHRERLHDSIDELESGGETAIGEGMLTALDDLDSNGNKNHDWAAVVLSDGKETADEAETIDDFIEEYKQRKNNGDPVPEVHAVGLGPDADREAMQDLAKETGGTYQFAAVPADAETSGTATTAATGESDDLRLRLPGVYRVISEEVAGEQQVFAGSGSLDEPAEDVFPVDGGAEELTVAVSGDTVFSARLTDPSGTVHEPDRVFPGGGFLPHDFFRIAAPEAGEWTLTTSSEHPEDCFEICATVYQADAAVTSRLTMEAFLGLAPDKRQVGRAMPILVSLSDTGPITGANVNVEVTAPDGSSSTLELFDDGAHDDGEAGDGFYGTTYRATHQEGDYVAIISADGSSGAFGDFSRRARTSFGMTAGDDSDDDGLPPWWENEFGTDPDAPDGTDDPDDDGLTNLDEWLLGAHPLNPDTDNGGEADGTDPDPLDPADDRLPTPDAEAYPGVGEVIVRYSESDAYDAVRVRRTDDPAGSFTTIADDEPATGEYTDTAVSNDQEFCYRVVGVADGTQSGPSQTTCATPRTDPIPPEGLVLIEDGAPATADPDVTLDLMADDNPEPHLDQNHPGAPPRPEDAEESGVVEMRLANQGDLEGVDWEPFAATREWTLPDEPGPATVFVQYRDGAGNTSLIAHDTIELVEDGDGDDGGEGVTRQGGPTRLETAREISRHTHDSADTVVVARADEYADALAGAPLATHLGGPVLLTGGGQLHPATAAEIERLGASEVVLLGGQAALSQQVADDVADLGVDVRRLGGSNRFDTARLVANELPAADEVYVAEGIHTDPGRGWPDAMSAAGAAAGQQTPVLLVAHGLVPEATTQALGADQDVAIVGGTAAVSADVADTLDAEAGTVRRLSGSTRYDTSAAVADDAVAAGADPATTWVATGREWADALVSAAATGHANGTLVMVDGQNLEFSPASRDWIADHADQIATLNLAGGTAAISSDTAHALTALIQP